jgi:hypothetical protein
MMITKWVLVFSLIVMSAGVCGRASARHARGPIRVQVVHATNPRNIRDARVFVLSETGRELASAVTNERGIAELVIIPVADAPKYVLVEHPAFFLSGMKWVANLQEYYILMTVLTVR